jgi:hypothetical protein
VCVVVSLVSNSIIHTHTRIRFTLSSIGELVHNEETGLLFDNAEQLADRLEMLLADFADERAMLDHLRCNVIAAHERRWPQNWDMIVLPLFDSHF